MTYLPTKVSGRWFDLYLILDLYSRKIVGWEVHATDDSGHAAHLVKRTALAEGIAALGKPPVLHGDNGATLKATTVLEMLHWLGIKPSCSQPRVSDDNAYVAILAARHTLYQYARDQHPARWNGHTRNWNHIQAVTLNPERDCVVHDQIQLTQRSRAA